MGYNISTIYKPSGVPDFIPYLTVRDSTASIKFYHEAFGFELVQISNDTYNKPAHVEMKFGEAIIMFCYEGAFGNDSKSPATQKIQIPVTFYIYCHDVDKLYDRAIKYGAKSKTSPSNGFWGDRFCSLIDIDGYEWSFATYIMDNLDSVTKH